MSVIYVKIGHRFILGGIMPNEPIKEDPVERFRKLLRSLNPLGGLPKRSTSKPSSQEDIKMDSLPKKDSPASKLPVRKITASNPKPQPAPAAEKESKPSAFFGPRLWNFTSILLLGGNLILIIVVIVLLIVLSGTGLTLAKGTELLTGLLNLPGGLYANFEKMDRASIQTNVVVNTEIPVQFDLQLNQQTNVVLSEDVTITNALVTVNTGGLNISRANTTIVLPAGTTLPVFLNLTVPVDTQIPITLDVPVNIPLSETELNEPFVGLQQVIKPLYCGLNPAATNLDGVPICP
jgi:hypothetical protein